MAAEKIIVRLRMSIEKETEWNSSGGEFEVRLPLVVLKDLRKFIKADDVVNYLTSEAIREFLEDQDKRVAERARLAAEAVTYES